MSATLEWRHLRQEDMKRLDMLPTFDSTQVAQIILEADSKSSSPAFCPPIVRNSSQKNILLDAVFHLLRFARSHQMTQQKQSTLVSILLDLHRESTENHLSSQASYTKLEQLLMIHSVQRPPHGLAIFRLDETRAVADYFTATYFRHYTLYMHAFTHRKELTVVTKLLGDGAVETLPSTIPPLFSATPLASYEANVAEKKRLQEEAEQRRREAEEERAMLEAEEQRKLAEAEDAARREVPQGLRAQLLAVKHQVGRSTLEHLTALDQKLQAIEQRVAAETLSLPGAGSSMRGGPGGAGGAGGAGGMGASQRGGGRRR